MKYKWLNKLNNKRIIVFFNGWGMDENVVKHLQAENYDVIMFYDYNTIETDFNFPELNKYEEKNLIAWSMGVMIASILSENINFNKKVAINGTLRPIDEKFGIHPKIYDLTIKSFNEIGKIKFIKNMFSTAENLITLRDVENQRDELIALKNYKSNEDFTYNKVIISSDDKIIPTKNQCAFWNKQPNLNSGHCPFLQFKTWSELL